MFDDDEDVDQGGKPEGADKGDKGGKDENVTLTKSEVEQLRREAKEARESERYWADQARSRGGAPARPQAAEEDDTDVDEFLDDEDDKDEGLPDDTPEKMVDELAAKGVSALSKRGFITKKDAIRIATAAALKVGRTLISRERTKITSDTKVMTDFPELKDQNSALFKATAKNYQDVIALDPKLAKTPAALYLAAKAAKAELQADGRRQDRRRGDDDDYEPESEADRRRRASSQDSRPRGRSIHEDDDDMLGDEARQVIKGFGITDEEFKAARKDTMRSTARRR